jgi:hypothetical protein
LECLVHRDIEQGKEGARTGERRKECERKEGGDIQTGQGGKGKESSALEVHGEMQKKGEYMIGERLTDKMTGAL